ncbi:MAG: EAL domain-containing protein [Cyanobacteria bacterium P01_F01_bin.42]
MTYVDQEDYKAQLQLAEYSFECTAIPAFWITQSGSIFRANQAACNALGYERQELQSLSVFDIDPSASRETWLNHWLRLKKCEQLTFNTRHRTKAGEFRHMEVTINFLKVGANEYNFAFAKDLTAQRDAELALKETQKRHSLVVQATNDGIWDWDLETQRICFSARWYEMLEIEAPQSHQTIDQWLDRIHPDDRRGVHDRLDGYRNGASKQLKTEFRVLNAQGNYIWILCRAKALYDRSGNVVRIAGSLTDITERRQAQEQLRHDAFHDPLTGLPNRRFLQDQLDQMIAAANRHGHANFAVLFIDLDRFKLINDSLGHRTGDQLLIEVAKRLQASVSPEHTIARLGGDEFIILLRKMQNREEVIQTTKLILENISRPVFLDSRTIYPSLSIGISLGHAQAPGKDWASNKGPLLAEDYIQRADIAMNQAKKSSHSPYVLYTDEMRLTVFKRLQLEVDLQAAIQRGEFRLVYQPIVDLDTGQLRGFEALLRWHHPERGLIGPDLFIPIAEETGLIIPLGNWALREACRQMHQWQRLPQCAPDLFTTVNLASPHIMQPDFVDQVHQILRESEVSPHNIKLEITESAVIKNKDFAREQILALKDSHIRICMDDFGTGYSSLGYLHQLPIDCLKIDKSFVQQIQSPQDNPEIIRAILAIADSLGMNVIAEGIETLQQAKLLRAIGCPQGQGYLFERPISATGATRYIRSDYQNRQRLSAQTKHLQQFIAS